VCAVNASNGNAQAHFRTYHVPGNALDDCTIWEAARATSAAPYFFKPIVIKNKHGVETRYIDGGLRQNNPTDRLLREAEEVFPDRDVACIISLGTGQKRAIQLRKSPRIPKIELYSIFKLLQKITTDCEEKHQEIAYRFRYRSPNVYFRFNVEQGMQGLGLEEWTKLDRIHAFTRQYVQSPEADRRINAAVNSLWNPQPHVTTREAAGC
jgi:predicted acylesterase/phospholipase RssA